MKAAFHTLGCKVNQYETETIKEQFRRGGYEIVADDVPADVYVINTCTVTGLADRKSRQFIRRAHKLAPDAVIAVTGCYAQMEKEKVASIEGVDIVTGTSGKSEIFGMVEDLIKTRGRGADASADGLAQDADGHAGIVDVKPYEALDEYEDLGEIEEMEGRTRAFIKIQEGCDRFCAYCIIPKARGKVRSRGKAEILDEVRRLVDSGYKEIVLTGINTALYGRDRAGTAADNAGMSGVAERDADAGRTSDGDAKPGTAADGDAGIGGLIKAIDALPGDFRIRLSSLEPTVIRPDEAADLLQYKKLCHHMHLSMQSGSDRVLAAMNRRYDAADYLAIVRALRSTDPHYGISADVIVGFPGETGRDFEDSLDVIRKSALIKTHVFKYSKRKGTAAAEMDGQVDDRVKAARASKMGVFADGVRDDFIKSCKGTRREVLFERVEDGFLTGYTDNYIKVYVDAKCGAEADCPNDANACGGGFDASNPGGYLNRFFTVEIGEPYLDGAKAAITD